MAQLQPYPPVAIISVLPKFFEYRGITLAARERVGAAAAAAAAIPSADAIISNMGQFHYERIDGRLNTPRGSRDWVIVLILSASGKYSQNGPALRSLLLGIENERVVKEGRLDELFIFAEEAFFTKKNLTDVLGEFSRNAARGVDPAGRASYFTACYYHILVTVIPEHKSVPPHRIMTPAEVSQLLEEGLIKITSLPKILDNDPPIIWCGGREGQIVEVEHPSETAGQVVPYYHRIVRGKNY
jgi:DNA-directed RNA polymerase subunit H (RpoH/RPB5)